MSNLEFMWNLKNVEELIEIIRLTFSIFFSYYTFYKVIDIKKISVIYKYVLLLTSIIIAYLSIKIKIRFELYYSLVILVLLTTIINILTFKKDIIYSFIMTIISLSFNYIIYMFAVAISFFPIMLLRINNDYISLTIILCIYIITINRIFKIRKLKNGFNFLKRKLENTYFNILFLNIGIIILFLNIFLQNISILNVRRPGEMLFIITILMIITISKSFQLNYKYNQLVKELEQTKEELEKNKQEIDKLEKENLEFSKTSHSLAHKQKALEFKLEQLLKTDIDVESKEIIKEEIEKVSKELYKEPNEVKLAKTEIESIDNMFSYMQSECIKNNIKFELQVVGNMYYMINNLISENDLEILIADHIKDAIIAINHSDNSNRSILVRIGKIDNEYSLYIYDSGIEFTKEVLDNLGKKPTTTHADTGGTGMGFMNTFDTLNKTKASLIINEIGEPCEDNYTKALIFKFDKQNEFKVNLYKNEVVV